MIFRFVNYKGDFNCYFSEKTEKPNDQHGFTHKATNKDEVEFPANCPYLPGTNRFAVGKILYVTLETTEPCNILVESFQNYKDGRIPKGAGKSGPKKPSFKKDEAGKETKIHSTPGAKMTMRALLNVPEKTNSLKKMLNKF